MSYHCTSLRDIILAISLKWVYRMWYAHARFNSAIASFHLTAGINLIT